MNTSFLKRVLAVGALAAIGVSPFTAPQSSFARTLPPNRPETGMVFADKWSVTGPVDFMVDYKTATFTLRETEQNGTAMLTQDVTNVCMPMDWEYDVGINTPPMTCPIRGITYAKADIVNSGNITGLPSGFVYVLRGSTIVQNAPLLVNGETPIQNYAWRGGEWVVLSTPVIVVQPGDSLRFVLEQAEHVGTPKNGRPAVFEKPGVYQEFNTSGTSGSCQNGCVMASYRNQVSTTRMPWGNPGLNPLAAKQATCDRFFKVANRSSVWLVCSDSTRHAMANPEIYFSWASSWSDIRVVTQSQLNQYRNYGYAPMNNRWTTRPTSNTFYRQITNRGYVLTPVSESERMGNPYAAATAYRTAFAMLFTYAQRPTF